MLFHDLTENENILTREYYPVLFKDVDEREAPYTVISKRYFDFPGRFPKDRTYISSEKKQWLKANFSKKPGQQRRYYYIYHWLGMNYIVGVAFRNKDDAAFFMLTFVGTDDF